MPPEMGSFRDIQCIQDNLHTNLSDASKMSAASEEASASKGAIQILVG